MMGGAFLFLLIMAAASTGCAPEKVANPPVFLTDAQINKVPLDDSESWSETIKAGSFDLDISSEGVITSRHPVAVSFRLEPDVVLGGVSFAEVEGDLLLSYQAESGGNATSWLERLDKATLKPKWKTASADFNLAPVLMKNGKVYSGSQDYVSQIDLASGHLDWLLEGDDIAPGENLGGFAPVDARDNRVTFRKLSGDPDKPHGTSVGTVSIDTRTGKKI